MTNKKNRPLICLLASSESSPGVLYGLLDVLSSVGPAFPVMTTGKLGDNLLDVKVVAASKKPFRCFGEVLVEPHLSLDEISELDAVIVCDMYTPINTPPRNKYLEEIEWLKKIYTDNTILTSICSGSIVLAETGLLDGLEVSSHWAYRHLFCEYYPKTKWREDTVLNLSGEHKRIITTAGVSAWQDLAVYLITRFCGLQIACETAKLHLLAGHADGQLPFAAMTQNHLHNDAAIKDAQTWIVENYICSNPVALMTKRTSLKPRTFARRFRAATGYQPLEYVQHVRIEAAKKLLETQATSVEEIGAKVGYEDTASFCRLFKRIAGLTPAVYRRKFTQIIHQSVQPKPISKHS